MAVQDKCPKPGVLAHSVAVADMRIAHGDQCFGEAQQDTGDKVCHKMAASVLHSAHTQNLVGCSQVSSACLQDNHSRTAHTVTVPSSIRCPPAACADS
jgi:hypothetical protein